MADCEQTPTQTLFSTTFIETTLGITTLVSSSTSLRLETGSFPSTVCAIPGPNGTCLLQTVSTITYTISEIQTSLIPTATSTLVSRVTDVRPTATLFAPCPQDESQVPVESSDTNQNSWQQSETTLPNGSVSVTSIFVTVPSEESTETTANKTSSPPTVALAAGIASGVVGVALIGFIIWILWRKNRKMKKQIQEHEKAAMNMSDLVPTPYPYPNGPYDDYGSRPPDFDDSIRGSSPAVGATGTYASTESYHRHPHNAAPSTRSGFRPISSLFTSHTEGNDGTHDDGDIESEQYNPGDRASITGPSSSRPSNPHFTGAATSAAAISKTREARDERTNSRPRLVAHNMITEVVTPGGTTLPPSAWILPPPAYTRDA